MKIIVTGGAGFIGSAVVRHIIQETQDSVINVDKLTYAGNLESLAMVAANPRYHFEKIDICNRKEMDRIFRVHQPDAVMHLAAESHVDRSIDWPDTFVQTNIVGTFTLLEAARNYWQALSDKKKSAFRFHHISTDEVYGSLGAAGLFTENSRYQPNSPYSASKAASDHFVRAWRETYQLPTLVTNCSNNYGPYHFPEKLIPLVILNAIEGKPLPIYGKGDQVRDWLYVEDHARALYLVLTQGCIGETYNIGGHNEQQNLMVVQSICDILDEVVEKKPASIKTGSIKTGAIKTGAIKTFRELITHVTDRPGHDQRYAIDAEKIRKELGWMPKETFTTGLRKTVLWYLANLAWCQRVQDGSYQRDRLGLGS